MSRPEFAVQYGRFIISTILAFVALVAAPASAAIGPDITLHVETPLRAGEPVWLDVDVPDICIETIYPRVSNPTFFEAKAEVAYEGGTAASSAYPPGPLMILGPPPVRGPCRGDRPQFDATGHRFPLHLLYDFGKPGHYAVRWTVHDWEGEVKAQSDWVDFEVASASAREQEDWLRSLLAAQPTDNMLVIRDYIPSLLAAWSDSRVTQKLLDLMCSSNKDIATTAEYSLTASFDQTSREHAAELAAKGCELASERALWGLHGPDRTATGAMILRGALRDLDPANDEATAKSLNTAYRATAELEPDGTAVPDPTLLALANEQVAPKIDAIIATCGARAPHALALYLWKQAGTPFGRETLQRIIDHCPSGREQALTILGQPAPPP